MIPSPHDHCWRTRGQVLTAKAPIRRLIHGTKLRPGVIRVVNGRSTVPEATGDYRMNSLVDHCSPEIILVLWQEQIHQWPAVIGRIAKDNVVRRSLGYITCDVADHEQSVHELFDTRTLNPVTEPVSDARIDRGERIEHHPPFMGQRGVKLAPRDGPVTG